jgi:hypothetical protein
VAAYAYDPGALREHDPFGFDLVENILGMAGVHVTPLSNAAPLRNDPADGGSRR